MHRVFLLAPISMMHEENNGQCWNVLMSPLWGPTAPALDCSVAMQSTLQVETLESRIRIMYRKYGIWRRRSGIYNCSLFYFVFCHTALLLKVPSLTPQEISSPWHDEVCGCIFPWHCWHPSRSWWFGELGKYQSGGNNDFCLIGGK